MTATVTDELSDHFWARCGQCGASIWDYATPSGKHVTLDNEPGPYLIDGGHAYRSDTNDGYRGHWDHCERLARAPLSNHVVSGEFLWP